MVIPNASNGNASIGMRRYQRHHRSVSNSGSSTTVGTLDRLDLRQTGILPRDMLKCLLEITSHASVALNDMEDLDRIMPNDLWCWVCFKTLYINPTVSSNNDTDEKSLTSSLWDRQGIILLEQMLLMEEVEELQLGDATGFVAELVSGGRRNCDWQQLENQLVNQ
jgi:hypothetical protein